MQFPWGWCWAWWCISCWYCIEGDTRRAGHTSYSSGCMGSVTSTAWQSEHYRLCHHLLQINHMCLSSMYQRGRLITPVIAVLHNVTSCDMPIQHSEVPTLITLLWPNICTFVSVLIHCVCVCVSIHTGGIHIHSTIISSCTTKCAQTHSVQNCLVRFSRLYWWSTPDMGYYSIHTRLCSTANNSSQLIKESVITQ